jgi:hypothetical protein
VRLSSHVRSPTHYGGGVTAVATAGIDPERLLQGNILRGRTVALRSHTARESLAQTVKPQCRGRR